MKLLTEICLLSNNTWDLQVKEKKIDPVILGLHNTFCADIRFNFVRQLCYCDGVNMVYNDKADYFTEHFLDGNSEKLKYRSKLCDMSFLLKTPISTSCVKCKYVETKTKQHEQESAKK